MQEIAKGKGTGSGRAAGKKPSPGHGGKEPIQPFDEQTVQDIHKADNQEKAKELAFPGGRIVLEDPAAGEPEAHGHASAETQRQGRPVAQAGAMQEPIQPDVQRRP